MFHHRRKIVSLLFLAVVVAVVAVRPVHAPTVIASLACCQGTLNLSGSSPGVPKIWTGICFTSQVTGPVGEMDFWIGRNNQPYTGNIQAQLYSTTGTIATDPGAGNGCASKGAFLANSTTIIPLANVGPSTPALQQFFFTTGSVVAGQEYMAVAAFTFTNGALGGAFQISGNMVGSSAMALVDSQFTNVNFNDPNNDHDEFICTNPTACEAFNVLLGSGSQPTQPQSPSPYGSNPGTFPCCTPVTKDQLAGSALNAPDIPPDPFEWLFLILLLLTLGSYLIVQATRKQSKNPRQYEISV